MLNVWQGGTSLGEADAEIQGVLDANLYSVECLYGGASLDEVDAE